MSTAIFIVTYRAASGVGFRHEWELPVNWHHARRAAVRKADDHHVIIPGTLAIQRRRG